MSLVSGTSIAPASGSASRVDKESAGYRHQRQRRRQALVLALDPDGH
jgi:hypothetical protein